MKNIKNAIKKVIRITKAMLNPNIYVSDGNEKLQGDEKNAFLVWSIPAISTCHWSTELCRENCYARQAEIQYKDCLPCRKTNLAESKKESFVKDMVLYITWCITARPTLKGKKIWFRIHESGDFYSLEYLLKWCQIAEAFPEITFEAYTKAVSLIELALGKIPQNLVIRYSVWEDTKPEEMEIANKLELPIYTAFKKNELEMKVAEENYIKCDCDCSKCKDCYTYDNKRIATAIHGNKRAGL